MFEIVIGDLVVADISFLMRNSWKVFKLRSARIVRAIRKDPLPGWYCLPFPNSFSHVFIQSSIDIDATNLIDINLAYVIG